ncbi:MAG: nuclear transport factor 2 family protein [Myxococcota bacterium]|nr:nuclear transport factor 2 family protein [Myxococcota bacterium]
MTGSDAGGSGTNGEAASLEDLLALESIRRLKYRYLRCLDTKDWDDIEGCFTDDATAAYSGGKYTFEGRAAIVDFLKRSMGAETFHSSHHAGHPEIRFDGPDRARGTWKLDDVVIETKFQITIRGSAFYEDVYVRGGDGAWRIEHTGYKRVYEEISSRADIQSLKLTASYWSTDGRSELPAG